MTTTHGDMGIFDFFRSRSSSLRGRNSNAKSSTDAAASVPAQPPASTTGAATAAAHAKPAATVPVPPASAPAALDSMTTTVSVESASNNNTFSDSDSDGDDDMDVDSKPAAALASAPPVSLGSIQNYEIVKELGRGATAVVQLGRHRESAQLVALKVLKTSLLKKMREVKRVGRRMVVSTALDKVQIEIAIMKKLQHAHLLNLLEVFDDDSDTLVLMLEYAPHGQVMHWDAATRVYRPEASASRNVVFDEDELRRCAQQLLLGLEYLHSNNICHRDLKPENILVGAEGVYKIADFGVAHLFDETPAASTGGNQSTEPTAKRGYVSTTAGTYAFMAPETLKGGAFDAFAADVWALGITLHALALGTIPFYDPDVVTLFEQIEHTPIVLPTTTDNNNNNNNNNSSGAARTVSPELAEFLYGLLEKDPEKRWALQQCKQNAWVREGLDESAARAFLEPRYEAVTVSSDDVANAVTKVSSFNVLLRVKLGANRWLRKAQKSSDERKRASLTADDIHSRSSLLSSSSSTVDDSKAHAPVAAATGNSSSSSGELPDNQAEI